MRNYTLKTLGFTHQAISFPTNVVKIGDAVVFDDKPQQLFKVKNVNEALHEILLEAKPIVPGTLPITAYLSPAESNIPPNKVFLSYIDKARDRSFSNIVDSNNLHEQRNVENGTLIVQENSDIATYHIVRATWIILTLQQRCCHGVFHLCSATLSNRSNSAVSLDSGYRSDIGSGSASPTIPEYEYAEFAPDCSAEPFYSEAQELPHSQWALPPAPFEAPPVNLATHPSLQAAANTPDTRNYTAHPAPLRVMRSMRTFRMPIAQTSAQIAPAARPTPPSIIKVVWMVGLRGMLYSAGSFLGHKILNAFRKPNVKWFKQRVAAHEQAKQVQQKGLNDVLTYREHTSF